VNPGVIFSTMMKLAPGVIKPKLIQRVKELSKADVLKYIDEDQLITDYGGKITYNPEKWYNDLCSQFGSVTSKGEK
jgi:hypothetical protein